MSDALSSRRGSAPKSKGQLIEIAGEKNKKRKKAIKEILCYFSFLISLTERLSPRRAWWYVELPVLEDFSEIFLSEGNGLYTEITSLSFLQL